MQSHVDALLAYQREFLEARGAARVMLAARCTGKTRTAMLAALLSGQREYYVAASDQARDEALAEASHLARVAPDGCTLPLPIPPVNGGPSDGQQLAFAGMATADVTFLSAESENLAGCHGNVTLDEPYDVDIFAQALFAVGENTPTPHELRIVGSALGEGGLMHQIVDGGAFEVFKTDIRRAGSLGYPVPEEWADQLVESDATWRQDYLCEFVPVEDMAPSLHWYDVSWVVQGDRAERTVPVPGTSRADACRVFNMWPRGRTIPREALAVRAIMSRRGVVCFACRAGQAVWVASSTPTSIIRRFYCEPCALPLLRAGGHNARSMYLAQGHRHSLDPALGVCAVCGARPPAGGP